MTIEQLNNIILQLKGSVDDDMADRDPLDRSFLLGKSVAYCIVLQLIEVSK